MISNNLASFRLHNLYFLSKIKKKSYISACFTRFRPFAAFSIRTLSLYKVFSIFIFRSWFRFISVGNEIGTNSSCQKDLLSRSFKMFGHNLKLGCAFVFFKGYNLEINFSFIFLELLRIWPLFFRQCWKRYSKYLTHPVHLRFRSWLIFLYVTVSELCPSTTIYSVSVQVI